MICETKGVKTPGMRDFYFIISSLIKEELDKKQIIALYPLGKIGLQARDILVNRYGKHGIIVDNHMASYNDEVIDTDQYMELDSPHITIILCASDPYLNRDLLKGLEDKKVKARIRNILEVPLIQYPEKEEYFRRIKALCRVKKAAGFGLIRIGQEYDGGYIMVNDFRNVVFAYSFGIGSDVSWDEGMAEQGVEVYCYDHTIEKLPKENRRLHFYKTGIAGADCISEGLLSMESIIHRNAHEKENRLVLKMDVEGAEWDFLNSVSSDILNQFSQMTFELHGVTDTGNSRQVIAALEKMNRTHQAVWVHANNAAGGAEQAGDIVMPGLLEITYVNRQQYRFLPVEYHCPLDIDMPNIVDYCDIELYGWGSEDMPF